MYLSSTMTFIITLVPALLIVASGIFKLTGSKQVIDTLAKVGVVQYAFVFGIAEIVFGLLFLFPTTNLIGFVLCACYFSGAFAVDLSHKNKIVPPIMILALLFIAELITRGNLFV